MRRADGQGSDLAWAVLFVVASVIGGLAAADITHESPFVALGCSLLVAAIMVAAMYRGLLDRTSPPDNRQARRPYVDERRPPALPAGQGWAASHPAVPDPPGGPRPARPPAPDVPVQPGLVRLVQPGASGAWWEGQTAAGAGPQEPAPAAVPPADLSKFIDKVLIAQCPNCGAFGVDVNDQAPELIFGCQECRHRWTWQPGQPWPVLRVRPSVRGRPGRRRT
jgi:hypothetical protein